MDLTLYFDGLCQPHNPGGIACFGWLIEYEGQLIISGKGEVARGSEATNNVAEYAALIAGLEALAISSIEKCQISIKGDSQLVIRQLLGEYNVKSSRLMPLYAQAIELLDQLAIWHNIHLEWIPRERNVKADSLSRQAYEEALRLV